MALAWAVVPPSVAWKVMFVWLFFFIFILGLFRHVPSSNFTRSAVTACEAYKQTVLWQTDRYCPCSWNSSDCLNQNWLGLVQLTFRDYRNLINAVKTSDKRRHWSPRMHDSSCQLAYWIYTDGLCCYNNGYTLMCVNSTVLEYSSIKSSSSLQLPVSIVFSLYKAQKTWVYKQRIPQRT